MKDVILGNGEHVCVELFVDYTNALVGNDNRIIAQFQKCLQIYCQASASLINHSKTGMRAYIQKPPDWLIYEGCKPIQDGEIVRILGIQMGFRVSIRKHWQQTMNKIEGKLKKWRSRMLNLAGRRVVLNHCIIPTVFYFLSYWRSPEEDLKQFMSLCRKYL